jgi:hypothetical protein
MNMCGALHATQKGIDETSAWSFQIMWRLACTSPFPSGQSEWCEICRQWGHVPPHFPTLQKYQATNHTPFCEFCKSIGHDINSCRSLQMMQDNTQDAFWVQEEQKGGEHGVTIEEDIKEDLEVGMDMVMDEDMVEEVEDPPHASIAVRLVMSHGSALSHMCSVHTCYSPKHVTEDCPDLLKKWEDKKGNCNMVHVEPCKKLEEEGRRKHPGSNPWRGEDRGIFQT